MRIEGLFRLDTFLELCLSQFYSVYLVPLLLQFELRFGNVEFLKLNLADAMDLLHLLPILLFLNLLY